MSRIGKIVRLTTMKEQFPQQWKQDEHTGLVTEDSRHTITILNESGSTLTFFKKSIMEVFEL